MGHQINIVSTDRANVVASAAIGAREGTTPQSTRLTAGRESWDRRALDPSRHLAFTSNERSEEHTSELQSLMRISYAVFCLKKKKHNKIKLFTDNETTDNI